MPEQGERWQDVATENRVRIENLEREAERQRDRTHELSVTVATVALLAERVGLLANELKELGERFERLARRALERPTVNGWAALANWAAVLIAIAALVLASRHG